MTTTTEIKEPQMLQSSVMFYNAVINGKATIPKYITICAVIYGPGQEYDMENHLKKIKKVIKVFPPAVNKGYGGAPRNTLMLFEPNEEWLK